MSIQAILYDKGSNVVTIAPGRLDQERRGEAA